MRRRYSFCECAALLCLCACVHQRPVPAPAPVATAPSIPPPEAARAAEAPANALQTPAPGTVTAAPSPGTQTSTTGPVGTQQGTPRAAPSPPRAGNVAPRSGTSTGNAPLAAKGENASASGKPGAATAGGQVVPAQPSLDLSSLEQRLRDTRAIGVFTKLSLKNQVDDLLAEFRAFHHGQSTLTLPELRQRYESLLLKVVSLLQDGDPALAAEVLASREAIWGLLADPRKFAQI